MKYKEKLENFQKVKKYEDQKYIFMKNRYPEFFRNLLSKTYLRRHQVQNLTAWVGMNVLV